MKKQNKQKTKMPESKKKVNSVKEFFRFTKSKIIAIILLYIFPMLSPSFMDNLMFYAYYPPVIISQLIISLFSINYPEVLTFLPSIATFFIINLFYAYLLSCLIIFIYQKLKKK